MRTTTHTGDTERLAHVAACLHQVSVRASERSMRQDGQKPWWETAGQWGWVEGQAMTLMFELNLPAETPPDQGVPAGADVNELLADVEATIRPVRLGDFLVPPAWTVRLLELQAEVARLAR